MINNNIYIYMHSIQEFMSNGKFIISCRWRIDNLVTNAQIANKIEFKKEHDLIEITFIDRLKNKKSNIVTFSIPARLLSTDQSSKLLSYKKRKINENNNNSLRKRSYC